MGNESAGKEIFPALVVVHLNFIAFRGKSGDRERLVDDITNNEAIEVVISHSFSESGMTHEGNHGIQIESDRFARKKHHALSLLVQCCHFYTSLFLKDLKKLA